MATVRPHVLEKKKASKTVSDHKDKIEYIEIDEKKFKTRYKLLDIETEKE